jgi:RNA polymerase sigma-70 factor (ECF subfamily)
MFARSASTSETAERAPWSVDPSAIGTIDGSATCSDIRCVMDVSGPALDEETRGASPLEPAKGRGVPPDAAEFDALLLAVLTPAYGYALRLTRHRADAEDLVQEASLLACGASHSFEAGTNFKAWFFRILVRCFYARHRTAQRRPQTVELDDTPDIYLYGNSIRSGLPSSGEDPASLLLDRLGTERVVEAISQLPTEYGVVCTLYFMEDFAYHEIAEVLDVPVGTVRSRLHRGRKMLQKALWSLAQEAGVVSAMMRPEGELS